jgi:hypothetical protein
MNERIYSTKELGIHSDKIVQVVIGRRLLYKDMIDYIQTEPPGYVVIANSDILFDKSLGELRKSSIHKLRILYAQLRHEYDAESPELSAIASACSDAQDVWIFHSNHKIIPDCQRSLQFPMGIPGCDNKMVHIANLLGFKVANEPRRIRCFHDHTSNVRSYTSENRIPRPYTLVFPKDIAPLTYPTECSFGPMPDEVSFYDNDVLRKFLAKKGFDPLMGARPMQRLIQDTIRKALADELLFGRLIDGGRLSVDLDDKDEVLLDIQPLPKKEGRNSKSEPHEPEEATAS